MKSAWLRTLSRCDDLDRRERGAPELRQLPLRAPQGAGAAARALRVRGLPVLPHRARSALRAQPRSDHLSLPQGRHAVPGEGETEGGRYQFPYLVDPNNGVSMYESADIVEYLFSEYGEGARLGSCVSARSRCRPRCWRRGSGPAEAGTRSVSRSPRSCSSSIPTKARRFAESRARRCASSSCRTSFDNVPRRSPDRSDFVSISGKMQVPYLLDPNTGVRCSSPPKSAATSTDHATRSTAGRLKKGSAPFSGGFWRRSWRSRRTFGRPRAPWRCRSRCGCRRPSGGP